MTDDYRRIGPTAHYTAYVWRQSGFRHAERFSTWQGAALYWGFFAAGEWMTRLSSRTPSMRVYLEYRHRLIEAVVRTHEPDVLIEVGAGLTPRAAAFAIDGHVRAVEFDLPDMVARKRAALSRFSQPQQAVLALHHRVEPADVTSEGFAEALRRVVGTAERPVVVAEGLLSYLQAPARHVLYHAVAGALGRDGLFVCDLHTLAGQASVGAGSAVLRTAIRAVTRRKHALDPYRDAAHVRSAMREAGLTDVEFVDAADYWTFEPRLRRLHSPTHVVTARSGR